MITKKIINSALGQSIGGKINSGLNSDSISARQKKNKQWELVFVVDETTTVSYTYDNQDDIKNDFDIMVHILDMTYNY